MLDSDTADDLVELNLIEPGNHSRKAVGKRKDSSRREILGQRNESASTPSPDQTQCHYVVQLCRPPRTRSGMRLTGVDLKQWNDALPVAERWLNNQKQDGELRLTLHFGTHTIQCTAGNPIGSAMTLKQLVTRLSEDDYAAGKEPEFCSDDSGNISCSTDEDEQEGSSKTERENLVLKPWFQFNLKNDCSKMQELFGTSRSPRRQIQIKIKNPQLNLMYSDKRDANNELTECYDVKPPFNMIALDYKTNYPAIATGRQQHNMSNRDFTIRMEWQEYKATRQSRPIRVTCKRGAERKAFLESGKDTDSVNVEFFPARVKSSNEKMNIVFKERHEVKLGSSKLGSDFPLLINAVVVIDHRARPGEKRSDCALKVRLSKQDLPNFDRTDLWEELMQSLADLGNRLV